MLRMLRKESGRCFRAEKGVLKKKTKKAWEETGVWTNILVFLVFGYLFFFFF